MKIKRSCRHHLRMKLKKIEGFKSWHATDRCVKAWNHVEKQFGN